MSKEESKRQKAKEDAVLLALQGGMALIRRELEIYGMRVDGSIALVSRSNSYDTLWEDALRILQLSAEKEQLKEMAAHFRQG